MRLRARSIAVRRIASSGRRSSADEVLDWLNGYNNPTSQLRMVRLHGAAQPGDLFETGEWRGACDALHRFNHRLGLAESGDLFE